MANPSSSSPGDTRNKKRKIAYDAYISLEEALKGINDGSMIKGGDRIVLVSGLNDRNRALNGDIVCVVLLTNPLAHYQPEDGKFSSGMFKDNSSTVRVSSSTKESSTDRSTDYSTDCSTDRSTTYTAQSFASHSHASSPLPTVSQGSADESTRSSMPLKGKVVFVFEPSSNRLVIGCLKKLTGGSGLLEPRCRRDPSIYIPRNGCPEGFVEQPQRFFNIIFLARILGWKVESPFAYGELVKELGAIGDLDAETEALLHENSISEEFNDEVLKEAFDLPSLVTNDVIHCRKDLRSVCVVSIDPSGAKDLDDCVSCEVLSPGVYRVGVHIADVSFYIKPGMSLDKDAFNRATSVYLVNKTVTMLPGCLCEKLLSLTPNSDKLTFSVTWTVKENGDVSLDWIDRSVINSSVQLSYEDAQHMIDNPKRDWMAADLPPIFNSYAPSHIRDVVININKVGKVLKKKRFANGGVTFSGAAQEFELDTAGQPIRIWLHKQTDSMSMIEELMLLANFEVARVLFSSYPTRAVLRNNPYPPQHVLAEVSKGCQKLNVELDTSSSGSIQNALSMLDDQPVIQCAVNALCRRIMQRSEFVCGGEGEKAAQCRHYALGVDLYTQFTSPIRRYSDVLVHRQLSAALGITEYPVNMTEEDLVDSLKSINERSAAVSRAQRSSIDLHLCAYLVNKGPILTAGVVTDITEKWVEVLVEGLDITKKVYQIRQPTLFPLSRVSCRVECERGSLKWNLVIIDEPEREQVEESEKEKTGENVRGKKEEKVEQEGKQEETVEEGQMVKVADIPPVLSLQNPPPTHSISDNPPTLTHWSLE